MIKRIFLSIRDMIVKGKFYLNRSSSYLAIVNLALLLNLSFTNIYMRIISIIIGLAGLVLFGFLDVHVIKSYEQENRYIHANTPIHPIYYKILEELKEIKRCQKFTPKKEGEKK